MKLGPMVDGCTLVLRLYKRELGRVFAMSLCKIISSINNSIVLTLSAISKFRIGKEARND